MNQVHWRSRLIAAAALLVLLPGCPSDPTPVADAGTARADTGIRPDGGGDPCDGITQCATAGTSCTGDTLVTCAPNADGCRIETRVECVAPMVCDDSGATAMCAAPDMCAGVPVEDRCDTAGRTCDTNTLQVCEANAAGCLVQTDTDCAAAPGGVCGDDAGMSACLVPVDPCADIPMAERCDTAGTSCSTDDLVTCAPNAFGCLVTTTTDCTARAGGACDATGAAAVCTATDPCAGIATCAAAGAMCSAGALVTCAADSFGCLVETSTDCTTAMFGFCDMDASGGPTCTTGATDPCMGMTTCDTAGRACDMDTLNVCAPNALGCLVVTPTDCTADMDVCSDAGAMPACVDPCSLVDVCPSATYCDANAIVSCAADSNGCLVEASRTDCVGSERCSGAGGAPACTSSCPGAAPTLLDCTTRLVMGNTALGTMELSDYECSSAYTYPNLEEVHVFRTSAAAEVRIVGTRLTGTRDYDLYVLDAGDPAATCTTPDLPCAGFSTGRTATEIVNFVAEPGRDYYVVYDLYGTTIETTDYSLAITCTAVVCGDGIVGGSESCDDGGTAPGDGCSAACATESGYLCTGAPSSCVVACGNGVVDSGMGESCDDGARVPGDGCSDACAIEMGYLCTGSPSVCELSCGNGVVNASLGETCDDGARTSGDGCSSTCTTEFDYVCTGAPSICTLRPYTVVPIAAGCIDTSAGTVLISDGDDVFTPVTMLPFAVPFAGITATHFRASSNGFIQLAASASFSGSTANSNGTIPATATPNGFLAPFWDDLVINAGGSIRTLVSGSAGGQIFVVEYSSMRGYTSVLGGDGAGLDLQFQAHIAEATGIIEFHYCSMTNSGAGERHTGSSATIGIENATGTNGVEVSRNVPMSVMTGSGFRFTPRP